MKFRVKFRKRKKFEESAASPGDKVALEVEVGSEELEVKGGGNSKLRRVNFSASYETSVFLRIH